MSILLEALRKSEKSKRPHETPTIHTDDQSGTPTEPIRTMPLALLLIAALLLTGWMVWKQYQPPVGSYQPPVTLQPGKVQVVPQLVVAEEQTGDVAPQTPVVAAAPETPVVAAAAQNRTPVESYRPPAESAPRPASSTTPSSADENPGTPRLGRKTPTSEAAGITSDQPAEISKPVETAPQEFHPGEPEPISYWELPDAVRTDVPEIKFSVLVYAANPSDRFVLINGQRLGEGDAAQPGLVVKEIRRDGVVFSYRLYQFLVER